MLVNDALANPAYNIDFAKFLGTITGSVGMGPGAAGIGGPAGIPAAGAGPAAGYY